MKNPIIFVAVVYFHCKCNVYFTNSHRGKRNFRKSGKRTVEKVAMTITESELKAIY